jgi:hypothetical protein
LLQGFLAGKHEFAREDVQAVAREIESEGFAVPRPAAGQAEELLRLPVGVGLDLDDDTVKEAGAMLSVLRADQLGARLQRLERTLLRLERTNSATLGLLQRLVQGARKSPPGAAE